MTDIEISRVPDELRDERLKSGDIKIQLLNEKGEPWKKGDSFPRKHRFVVEGPGIDPMRVASVKLPDLSYADDGIITVEVQMYPVMPG
jgi:hypothetical protein